ncbi:MAG TPA: RNA polymerase sigma factor [Myxococcales bacterium]|nr:RNA polymerase sigma factor [Myxococcales bacterium]
MTFFDTTRCIKATSHQGLPWIELGDPRTTGLRAWKDLALDIMKQQDAALHHSDRAQDTASATRAQTDEILIDRVRAGDRSAFDEIYRRYFKRVYGFLDKRLRNRADCEETAQEVFINIFSSLDSFRGEAPFAAWVFGLTRRTLASRFRRKQHPTVALYDDEDEHGVSSASAGVSSEASPLENYEFVELAAHLTASLENAVSPEQRQLFELHHLQSMPIAEIARTLSKSEDSVKSNLYRTRKVLMAR